MGLLDTFLQFGAGLILERPTRSLTPDQATDRLESSGRALLERCATLGDSDYNRRVLSHIIGIERWGQSRLNVFLGAAFQRDEYNSYRPARETSWQALQSEFTVTRAETVRLARALATQSAPAVAPKVVHNMFGPLSALAWMRYLEIHADRESTKMRPAAPTQAQV